MMQARASLISVFLVFAVPSFAAKINIRKSGTAIPFHLKIEIKPFDAAGSCIILLTYYLLVVLL